MSRRTSRREALVVKTAGKASAAPSAKPPARTFAVPVAVGLTALAPFVQPLGPVDPYTARFAGVMLAALSWLFAWALNPSAFRWHRPLVAATGAVAAATIVSALASYSPGVELTWGAEGGYMAAPTWLALQCVFLFAASARPGARATAALKLLFLWGGVSAVMVIWERATSAPQVTGGFGNGNFAGAALVTLVPLALFFAVADESKLKPWWRYLALLLIAGVVLSGSLANNIALLVVAATACLIAPRQLLEMRPAEGRKIGIAVLALLLLAGAVIGIAATTDILPNSIDTFITTRVTGPTAETRLEMWKMALGMFGDHPLVGIGPDGMQHVSQSYLTERLLVLESGRFTDYRVLVKDPHSLPLLALASLGTIGFAVLAWLGFGWIRELWRRLARTEGQSKSWALRVALGLAVTGHLTALLFMPWAISFGPLLPLLAGLAVAGAGGITEDAAPARRTVAPLVAAALATFAVGWLVGAAVYGHSRVSAAAGQSSPELARDQYLRAAKAQPTRPYVAYEALYAEGFLASDGLADLKAYQQAVDGAAANVTANAGFLANLVQPSLDEAYLSGRTDLGWEDARIKRAAAAAPNHPDVLLEQAHVELLSGRFVAARDLLERVRRMSPAAPRFLLYSYYLALAEGDAAAAKKLEPLIEKAGPGHSRLAKGWTR